MTNGRMQQLTSLDVETKKNYIEVKKTIEVKPLSSSISI